MKKVVFITLVVIVTVAVATGLFIRSGRVQAVSVKTINVKDFPEHGLSIISSSNPSFDGMMNAYLRNKPNISSDVIQHSSVFLRNTGGRVVAIKLRWEMTKPDGTTVTRDESQSTLWMLTHVTTEAQVAQTNTVMQPNSTWFLSFVLPFENVDEVVNSTGANSSEESSLAQEDDQLMGLRALNKQMAGYTNITVSIDGAFFDDGTFIGPDTTGFFAEIKAFVDARYDLVNELETAANLQKPIDEVFNSIAQLANQSETTRKPESMLNSTPTSIYKEAKGKFAQQVIGMRRRSEGDGNKATKLASELLRKPRVTLRKL